MESTIMENTVFVERMKALQQCIRALVESTNLYRPFKLRYLSHLRAEQKWYPLNGIANLLKSWDTAIEKQGHYIGL